MTPDSWEEGQRAWDGLTGWLKADARQAAQGYDAMAALGDVRLVRAALNDVEGEAVRGARVAGRSWAHIAGMLGITRQSAWERWRDVVDRGQAPVQGAADPLDLVIEELMHDGRRNPKRESIRLVKARQRDDDAMLAVTFEDEFSQPYFGCWGVTRATATTWRLSGGAFSSRLHGKPVSDLWRKFGGWGNGGSFTFGGVPADPAVVTVWVRDPDGVGASVDAVEGGVAMFLDWRGGPRSVVEMLDADNQPLYSGPLR